MFTQTWQKHLPDSIANAPLPLLPNLARNAHRLSHHAALASGAILPMYTPLALAPYIILPIYIAFWPPSPSSSSSSSSQPIRRSTWAVLAAIWALSIGRALYLVPTKLGWAYCSGVGALHLCSWAWHLLVNVDVHRDVMRVLRRPRRDGKHAKTRAANGAVANGAVANGAGGVGDVRQRKPGSSFQGAQVGDKLVQVNVREDFHDDSDEFEEDLYEYVWQGFPHEGSFFERYLWATDLVQSFRGSGWNISLSNLPSPNASKIKSGDPVDMSSMSPVTKAGFRIFANRSAFLRDRLLRFALGYIALDIVGSVVMLDPYFIIGPASATWYKGGLPRHLENLSPLGLTFTRCLSAGVGVYFVIQTYSSMADIIAFLLMERLAPSKGGSWMYASLFGSFSQILDRGLPGIWGSFWHQSMRMSFTAPAQYLIKEGYLAKGALTTYLTGVFLAFFSSGLHHALGSLGSIPLTKPWRPLLFFCLQPVGIAIQMAITSAARSLFGAQKTPPSKAAVFLRRAFNLSFVVLWFMMTGPVFMDDAAESGLWICEPVPFSFVKYLGFTHQEDDECWRWGPGDVSAFPEGWHLWLKWMAV